MVGFIDETFRDGPQSLWATRMRTQSMLGGAKWANRARFHRTCVTSGAAFETAVRFLGENPWERLRALRKHMPDAQLEVLVRSRNLFGWDQYSDDVVELLFRCMREIGIDWLKIFDGLNDYGNIAAHFAIARRLGFKTAGMVTFSLSPVHTDAHFAAKAVELARLGVDTVMMCDASGLMTAGRTRSILHAIRSAIGDQAPIEFYAHHSMGLAHDSCRAAIAAGVANVTTASRPLANGESVPATIDIARIADGLGIAHDLDVGAQSQLDDYFRWVAYQEGRPIQAAAAFDRTAYDRFAGHQIPGGMISNFRNQLAELGLMHRIDEVLEEASRVREELGFPVMVTPFSQFVGVQATMNVIQGERYKTIPNGVLAYVRGQYGKPPGPIDRDVMDKVLQGAAHAAVDLAAQFARPMIAEFRKAKGPFASDEDLLLHLFYGKEHVAAMHAKGISFDVVDALDTPLAALVRELLKVEHVEHVRIARGDLRLELKLNATGDATLIASQAPSEELSFQDVIAILAIVRQASRYELLEVAVDGICVFVTARNRAEGEQASRPGSTDRGESVLTSPAVGTLYWDCAGRSVTDQTGAVVSEEAPAGRIIALGRSFDVMPRQEGVVVEVLAAHETFVEYGQPLLRIEHA